jgi:digeranylgeranylglycerophospholipid reductase
MSGSFDVVVVGAGPAGSVAARLAAEAGLRTLLLEKRRQIGVPVRCAEAIGAQTAAPFISIDPRWIDAEITHFAIHNSLGEFAPFPPTEPTLVMDRKQFDLELATLAWKAGAELRIATAATGLVLQDGKICGVKVSSAGRTEILSATLVIAADGSESQVTRWAGMKTLPPLADYYIAVEFFLAGMPANLNPHMCEYHLDHDLAPGGYLWVFPKGDGRANVGLVVPADLCRGVRLIDSLRQFVARRCPQAKRLTTIAGGIPVTGAMKTMVTNGLMAVGDAAHQADPMMGGGICLGMLGAGMAMQVGIPAVQAGDVGADRLAAYDKAWWRKFGRMHASLLKVRKILARLEQSRLDALISRAARLPLDHMPLGKVFVELLKQDPGLLFEARTLITTGLIGK